MSHPVIEIAAALTVALALAVGLVVLPRHKPEPPQQEQRPPVESVAVRAPQASIKIEPLPAKTDAERIDKLEDVVGEIAAEQKNLSAIVKQLTEREKTK